MQVVDVRIYCIANAIKNAWSAFKGKINELDRAECLADACVFDAFASGILVNNWIVFRV
jgi:hypothetical protein